MIRLQANYSPYNGKVLPGYMFTDTGFWDTFRSLFPFLNFLFPSENVKIQEGLANAYRESGFLPEWASPGHRDIMVGNNSITTNNNSKKNRYITEMNLNGKKYTKNYLTHEELMKGATINFTMSQTPDKSRGINKGDFPYSFSNEK